MLCYIIRCKVAPPHLRGALTSLYQLMVARGEEGDQGPGIHCATCGISPSLISFLLHCTSIALHFCARGFAICLSIRLPIDPQIDPAENIADRETGRASRVCRRPRVRMQLPGHLRNSGGGRSRCAAGGHGPFRSHLKRDELDSSGKGTMMGSIPSEEEVFLCLLEWDRAPVQSF